MNGDFIGEAIASTGPSGGDTSIFRRNNPAFVSWYASAMASISVITINAAQTFHFPASTTFGITQTKIGGLTIHATGLGIVDTAANQSNKQLLVISGSGLTIDGSAGAWSGKLDLNNNDMDLATGSLATVTDQIRQGYANGSWAGTGGITSGSAAADSRHLTALGVIQNNQSGTALFTATNQFDGTTPGVGDILVKYTYYGDANLDGKVDGSDYSKIDNGYLTHATGWLNGDFNYDGVIDGSDYTLIDNAFNTQGAALAGTVGGPTVVISSQIAWVTTVPEPSLIFGAGVVTLAQWSLVRRKVSRRWRIC